MSPARVTIYVASVRPAKVEGTRDAAAAIARLDARFSSAAVVAADASMVAPRMPLTEAETVAGAYARAMAMRQRFGLARADGTATDGASFFVGVEGGLDPVPAGGIGTVYMAKTWACVSDGQRFGYGSGPSLPLPRAVAEHVLDGLELGDVIDRMAGAEVRGTRGAWGVLTLDLIDRREAFRLAVLSAFAPFYNAATYAT